MKTTLFFLLILYSFSNCQNCTVKNVDNFIDNPFHLKYGSIVFPDSIYGSNVRGFLVLNLLIDSSKKIIDHNIVRFKLYDNKNEILYDYYIDDIDNHMVNKSANEINKFINRISVSENDAFDKKYKQRQYKFLIKVEIGSN